jgi:hypothetical protein
MGGADSAITAMAITKGVVLGGIEGFFLNFFNF